MSLLQPHPIKHRDHMECFENEKRYTEAFREARQCMPGLKNREFRKILSMVFPDFIKSVFVRRPCVRTLKYVGYKYFDKRGGFDMEKHPFFRTGRVYKSMTFNGATYTIRGYGSRKCIGAAYFD